MPDQRPIYRDRAQPHSLFPLTDLTRKPIAPSFPVPAWESMFKTTVWFLDTETSGPVSYTHLTLPTTPYV